MVAAGELIQDEIEDAAERRGESPGDQSMDDAEDEGKDGFSRKRLNPTAALTAIAAGAAAALRPLAAVAFAVLMLVWTAMLWQVSGSLVALNDSASTIAAGLGTGQAAATVTEAGDPPAAASEAPATAIVVEPGLPAMATVIEHEFPFDPALPEALSIEPIPPPPATLLGRLVVTNGRDVWDCDDFETWEQAKLVYEANLPQDPNILDFFVTGVPCGHLQAAQ